MSVRSRPVALRIFDLASNPGGLRTPKLRSFAVALAQVDGPIIGMDVGIRHIGIAMSDLGRQISFSQDGFRRAGVRNDIERIRRITRTASAQAAVVGMPVALSGPENTKLQAFVREYSQRVLAQCGIQVVCFWDETYSTQLAKDAFMKRSRKTRRNRLSLRKKIVDAVRAQ